MTCCNTIEIFIEEQASLEFEVGEVYVVDSHDRYDGPYVVIPKTVDQVLPTMDKVMDDDVKVTEIPYAETSNVYGTTVSIAS